MTTPNLGALPEPAELPSEERERILKAAALAIPRTNPLIWQDWWEGHAVHTEADDIVAIWKAAEAAGRASRAQSEWISVGDQLPNIGDDVWIAAWAWNDPTRGQRIYGRATFIEAGKSYGNWANPQDDDTEYGWWPPTHWMPLPNSPEAK